MTVPTPFREIIDMNVSSDLTLNGGQIRDDSWGEDRTAELDSVNDDWTMVPAQFFPTGINFTLGFWFKLQDQDALTNRFLEWYNTGTPNGIRFDLTGVGAIQPRVWTDGSNSIFHTSTTIGFDDDVLHYLNLAVNGNTISLKVDDVTLATTPSTTGSGFSGSGFDSSTHNIKKIGSGSGGKFAKGYMTRFKIWDETLTSAQQTEEFLAEVAAMLSDDDGRGRSARGSLLLGGRR